MTDKIQSTSDVVVATLPNPSQALESLRIQRDVGALQLEILQQQRTLEANRVTPTGMSTAEVIDQAKEATALEDASWTPQYVDILGILRPEAGYGQFGLGVYPSTRSDRQDGRNRPIFQTETECNIIRGMARLLCDANETASGILEKLADYTLGPKGFEFKVGSSAGTSDEAGFVKRAQQLVDDFLEMNRVANDMDRELFKRGERDGEAYLTLWHTGNGVVEARIGEPEQCTEPGDPRVLEDWLEYANPSSWSFGIHTDADDVVGTHGYYFQWSSADTSWDYLPGGRSPCVLMGTPQADTWCEYIKWNTDSTVKRGLSSFYNTQRSIELATKLLGNSAQTGTVQSTIAWIEQNPPGMTKDQVNASNAMLSDGSVQRARIGGGVTSLETNRYSPGTILKPNAGRTYEAGPGAEFAESYLLLRDACLRSVASRWSFPEHMITGDASNNNFASILVAGDPFVKRIESKQGSYVAYFTRTMWKVLWFAHKAGIFGDVPWMVLRRLIIITVTPPDVEVRDRQTETQRKLILKNAKVISLKKWTAEEGYDFDQMQKEISEEPQQDQMPTLEAGRDGVTRGNGDPNDGNGGAGGGNGPPEPPGGPQQPTNNPQAQTGPSPQQAPSGPLAAFMGTKQPSPGLQGLAREATTALEDKDALGHGSYKHGTPSAKPKQEDGPNKSKGHIAFIDGNEFFKNDSGELIRAPISDAIMPNGRRTGRWEAPAHMADMRMKMLTPKPAQESLALEDKDAKGHGSYKRGTHGPAPKGYVKHPRAKKAATSKGGAATHKLPKNPKKLNLKAATNALAAKGIKVGEAHFDLDTKVTSYLLSDETGHKEWVTSDKIKELLYKGAQPFQHKPTEEVKEELDEDSNPRLHEALNSLRSIIALESNPNHKGTGEGGGQFTTGDVVHVGKVNDKSPLSGKKATIVSGPHKGDYGLISYTIRGAGGVEETWNEGHLSTSSKADTKSAKSVQEEPQHEESEPQLSSKERAAIDKADKELNKGVGKFSFPPELYHVTTKDRVSAISKNGLQVQSERTSTGGDPRGAYVTNDIDEVVEYGDIPKKDAYVVEIDTSGIPLRFDPEYYAVEYKTGADLQKGIKAGATAVFAYSKSPIPATAIKSVTPLSEWKNKKKNFGVTTESLEEARAITDTEPTEPTEAQKASGNYAKGKFKWNGLTIAIENPKDSIRKGKDKDGQAWSIAMPLDYGYILRTKSEADNDHIDVFIGPDLDSDYIFIVDQMRKDAGEFDEHKVLIGFDHWVDARRAYLSAYAPGWNGFGGISVMTLPDFLDWLNSGMTALPVAKYLDRLAEDEDEEDADESLVLEDKDEKGHGSYKRGTTGAKGISPKVGESLKRLTLENLQNSPDRHKEIESSLNEVANSLGLSLPISVLDDEQFHAVVSPTAARMKVDPKQVRAATTAKGVFLRKRTVDQATDPTSYRSLLTTAFHELGHAYDSQINKTKTPVHTSITGYEQHPTEDFADLFGARLGMAHKKATGKTVHGELSRRDDIHNYLGETAQESLSLEHNEHHNPKGPGGGQFAKREGGGVPSATEIKSRDVETLGYTPTPIGTWTYLDSEGRSFDQDVQLIRGDWTDPRGRTVAVYRWESSQDTMMTDHGPWTVSKGEAELGGKSHIRNNDEGFPPVRNETPPEASTDEDEPVQAQPKIAPTYELKKKSKARVVLSSSFDPNQIERAVQQYLGPGATKEDIASVVGAPDDAVVTVDEIQLGEGEGTGISVSVAHPAIKSCDRIISIDDAGDTHIHNSLFELNKDVRGLGLGTEIFANQVESAAAMGIKYIDCHAADGGMNGYYTWPQLGYDCSLDKFRDDTPTMWQSKVDDLIEQFPTAQTVQDIFDSEGGPEAWKAAKLDIYEAKFDLAPGSRSRKKLAAYVQRKKELSNAKATSTT